MGRYLKEEFKGDPVNRDALLKGQYQSIGADLLIHAAFGFPGIEYEEADYIDYQIALLDSLIKVGAQKLVFISSVDVFQQKEVRTPYAKAKDRVERALRDKMQNHLIIRAGLLVGPYMRRNQLCRVILENRPKLSLSGSSSFAPVFYETIVSNIRELDTGSYTVANPERISLSEVAEYVGSSPNYGDHTYETTDYLPDNVAPKLSKTEVMSLLNERINEYF